MSTRKPTPYGPLTIKCSSCLLPFTIRVRLHTKKKGRLCPRCKTERGAEAQIRHEMKEAKACERMYPKRESLAAKQSGHDRGLNPARWLIYLAGREQGV